MRTVVVGAGVMGHGIAQVIAGAGLDVTLVDVSEAAPEKALTRIGRLIVTLGLEAMRIVEEGIASVEDVNRACRLAFNHAMGPLNTMDYSRLDTALHVADAMREQYGERFLAPQNLRVLVNGGHLGRKTGRGFTDYGDA